jgi:acetyl-CoA C-acetyltransferase
MAAVQGAAASIRAGMDKVVIAGGAESLSTSPSAMKRILGTDEMAPWMSPSHPETPEAPAFDMSITVGWNTAQRCDITREDMDGWAYRSHMNAIAAIDDGRLAEEIFPLEVKLRDGTMKKFDTDEHPRRETSLEKLASLKPLHPEIDGFSITAGNASGINDGAAALLVVDGDYADAHGLQPMARIISWASAAIPPRDTGMGPIYAIPKALDRAGMKIADVDLAEVNEAFCSVPVATCKVLGLDPEKTNVNGSGCSLGHPVACTGARMIMTTMFELRRRGGGIGLASMCAGGGMGSATVFEVLPA